MSIFKKITDMLGASKPEIPQTTMDHDSIDMLEQKAAAGNAEAQYWLGRHYQVGEEVEMDIEKAMELLLLSDKQGFFLAANNIGIIYQEDRGDYEQALIWFKKGAKQNDHRAFQNLGRATMYGMGVEVNYEKALEYYLKSYALDPDKQNDLENQIGLCYRELEKHTEANRYFARAAEKGLPHAMYNMGSSYERALGMPQDLVKALYWYEKAAENDLIDAMYWTGWLYKSRKGNVTANPEKAVYWLEQAAENGWVDALKDLADMYENGKGVEKDLAKAQAYYQQLEEYGAHPSNDDMRVSLLNAVEDIQALTQRAESGDVEAQVHLGVAYKEGFGELEVNDALAFHWLSQAAEKDNAHAMHDLARLYEGGRGTQQDMQKAVDLYQRNAEQGYAYSQFNLANMYLNGDGVEKNAEKAAHWFQEAFNSGVELAAFRLGELYEQGNGVSQDDAMALSYYEAAENIADAQYSVGLFYYLGRGVKRNYDDARYYFEIASGNDFGQATHALGTLYENGQGVKRDKKKALELYQLAYDQGYEEALADFNRLK